jgi:hypothetical protein
MAGFLEAVGILLNNGAVHYINTDNNISIAFGGNPAMKQELQDEINHVKKNDEAFQKEFADDIKKADDLEKKADADKQAVDNEDPVVSHDNYGEPIYESKQFPGDKYVKRDDGGKIWIGSAKFHHSDDPSAEDIKAEKEWKEWTQENYKKYGDSLGPSQVGIGAI